MLTLKNNFLEKIGANHGLSPAEIEKVKPRIREYLRRIRMRNQGFYEIIDESDAPYVAFAKSIKGKYESVVVLGIGGSALGTIAIASAMKHLFENELLKKKTPKLYILDNVDPNLLAEIEDVIDCKKTLWIVVTKSGKTPETLAQFSHFKNLLEQKKRRINEHFVIITDKNADFLRNIAKKEKIPVFDIPENVGGRFSVLTAVGLLPSAIIGIDTEKFLKGARNMRDKFFSEKWEENLSFQIATFQYLLSKKGKTITVILPYSQKMFRFADWYRQLLAESIGKAHSLDGKLIHAGLTPVAALGVTDQHSQSQLYNEGPNDKFFIFLALANFGLDIKVPACHHHDETVNFLSGSTFGKLMHVEMDATVKSLTENKRPSMIIEIDKINPENLGALFMLFEGSIAFLGEFLRINAFDQPGVDRSKELTREMLLEK
ncbi:glucose-6-phosphate isomerase [Candidatus Peregrinibacteria bacterium]|nr:glucose-6-phosphate isomerase [Candidatus Peregrinibacteria bacterium]